MSETFIVADAHGRLDLVEGLIAQAGAERRPGRTVVQLGDLCNCVLGSIDADLACLEAAPDLFDVVLVGNHEHPYFGGMPFSGFWRDPQVESALLRLDWQPCHVAGEFLISHAGLAVEWGMAGAVEAALNLRAAWHNDPAHHPFFDQSSRLRGGRASYGGVLWADWLEPKTTAGMSQIVGHTPGPIRVQGQSGAAQFRDGRPRELEPDEPFVLCIDVGAAKGTGDMLAGCWIRGGKVELVIHSQAAEQRDEAA